MPIDVNNLPDEVLLYSNDEFYKFIEECLGPDEMAIIKVQSIRSTRSLINVPDVLEVLSLNCKELVDIKKRLCFVTDSNEFVVKAGIKAGINALVTTLKEKNNQQIKSIKGTRSSSQNHRADFRPSNEVPGRVSTDVLADRRTIPSRPLTIHEHDQAVAIAIERYCQNQFDDITLKNGIDYSIHLDSSAGYISGKITCGCRKSIKIYFKSTTHSFQLSAYFKHLRASQCTMMKMKKKMLLSKIKASIQRTSIGDELSSNDPPNVEPMNENAEDAVDTEFNTSSHELDAPLLHSSNGKGKHRSWSIAPLNQKKQKKT